MGDTVKITVIATGFKSESVGISRAVSAAAAASAAAVRPTIHEAAARPRDEEASAEPTLEELVEAAGPAVPGDLDVPAFLRKHRMRES